MRARSYAWLHAHHRPCLANRSIWSRNTGVHLHSLRHGLAGIRPRPCHRVAVGHSLRVHASMIRIARGHHLAARARRVVLRRCWASQRQLSAVSWGSDIARWRIDALVQCRDTGRSNLASVAMDCRMNVGWFRRDACPSGICKCVGGW
jgi:hypothetical protein